MSLAKLEKRSPCMTCRFAREVTYENLMSVTNDIRQIRNTLTKKYNYRDEDFMICPLDGGQAIVSKYVEWECPWKDPSDIDDGN